MSVFLTGVLFVISLAAILAWLAAWWRRVYAFDPGYAQVHLVRTEDGAVIGLFRYPAGGSPRHETPVILCHGLGANRYNFDLGPEKSLARYLQDRGFDVWVLELRGRGYSLRMGRKTDRYFSPCVFDDYVRRDAPAALERVRRETGASRVHWVGHSMGGLVLYGLLQGPWAGGIARGVAVASPGDFQNLRRIPGLLRLWGLARFLPRMHQRFPAALIAPILPWLPVAFQRLFYNPANVADLLIRRAAAHLASDVSRGEMLQFYDGMKHQELRTCDGNHSYRKGLAGIHRPLLLMAGTRDPLCPPESIGNVYREVSSTEKELRVLGRSYGEREEYGHGDLLIGKHCEQEVFPHIVRWLVQKDAPAGPGVGSPETAG